jgi:hypothetical protein
MKKHTLDFYKQLLGTNGTKFASLHDNFWDVEDKIMDSERLDLIAPITEQELKEAVFDSSSQGAPGPDG